MRGIQNTPVLYPPFLCNLFNHLSRDINDFLLLRYIGGAAPSPSPVRTPLHIPFLLPSHQHPAFLHRKSYIFVPQARSSSDIYEGTSDVEVLLGRSIGCRFRVRCPNGTEGGFCGVASANEGVGECSRIDE